MDVAMHDPNTIMEWSDIEPQEEYVFVDIQGFKVNKNRFMCKEFCLIDGAETFHAIVKSWYPQEKLLSHYKRQIDWLAKFFHGLTYECGDMHIDELTKIVYPKLVGKTVYVKGIDKIKWMQEIFRKCGEINCKNFEDLDYEMNHEIDYVTCKYHRVTVCKWRQHRCAMSNALKLQDISNKNAPLRFF